MQTSASTNTSHVSIIVMINMSMLRMSSLVDEITKCYFSAFFT